MTQVFLFFLLGNALNTMAEEFSKNLELPNLNRGLIKVIMIVPFLWFVIIGIIVPVWGTFNKEKGEKND